MKKNIKLVAALTGCSLAILIPVVAASAATVTTCPAGVQIRYCSVSSVKSWTVTQQKKTVTLSLTLPNGRAEYVGLSLPPGVALLRTASPTGIAKPLTFTSGRDTIGYTVTSVGDRLSGAKSFIGTLSSAEKTLVIVVKKSLFKPKGKSFTATLAVKVANGTTYLEQFYVKM